MLVQEMMAKLAKMNPTAKVVCKHDDVYVTINAVSQFTKCRPTTCRETEVWDDTEQPMFTNDVVLQGDLW